MDSYWAAQIHKIQNSGLSVGAKAVEIDLIQREAQSYQNPFVNMAYTFIEPLPVGLIITLISAAVLRRKAPLSERLIET
jgi:Na+/glutamate symporter